MPTGKNIHINITTDAPKATGTKPRMKAKTSAKRSPSPKAVEQPYQNPMGASDSTMSLLKWSGVLVIGAIGLWLYYNYKAAMRYCYILNNLRIRKFGVAGIDFDLGIKLLNNSDFKVDLLGYDLDIYIGDVKVANSKSSQPQTIYGGQASQLYINVAADPKKIGEQWSGLIHATTLYITAPDQLIFTVRGSVKTNLMGLPIGRFPINISMSYAEMMAPSAEDTVCGAFSSENKKGLKLTI